MNILTRRIREKNFMSNTMKENKMGTMPVNKLLINMALPMMISMLVQALYNIVDSIFVARISEEALTAVSMAFPMQNLMIGVAGGVGVGTNALLSRALGEGRHEEADKMAVQGIFITACSYIIFLAIELFFAREFFVIQGANEVIADYGYDYLSVILIVSFGCLFQMIFERLLQATGRTFYSMITQGTGAIINIILDPILIFGLFGAPKLGIVGAAVATVAGQIVAAVMAVIFNIKVNKEIHITFKGFRPSGKRICNILFIGIPSVIMMAIGSVMTFCMNKILVVFTSTAVAVFGVYFKLQSFAFMPIFGMNSGMVPIIAFNYGAKREDRVIQTLKLAVMYAEIIMILFMIAVQIFPVPMLSIFSASSDMIRMGVPALRTISISFIFAGICIICSSFFQALGSSIYSMLVSFVRQIIFLVPCAYIFSRTGNVNLVWWAWPIAELASVALSVFFFVRVKKKKFGFMEQ